MMCFSDLAVSLKIGRYSMLEAVTWGRYSSLEGPVCCIIGVFNLSSLLNVGCRHWGRYSSLEGSVCCIIGVFNLTSYFGDGALLKVGGALLQGVTGGRYPAQPPPPLPPSYPRDGK